MHRHSAEVSVLSDGLINAALKLMTRWCRQQNLAILERLELKRMTVEILNNIFLVYSTLM